MEHNTHRAIGEVTHHPIDSVILQQKFLISPNDKACIFIAGSRPGYSTNPNATHGFTLRVEINGNLVWEESFAGDGNESTASRAILGALLSALQVVEQRGLPKELHIIVKEKYAYDGVNCWLPEWRAQDVPWPRKKKRDRKAIASPDLWQRISEALERLKHRGCIPTVRSPNDQERNVLAKMVPKARAAGEGAMKRCASTGKRFSL